MLVTVAGIKRSGSTWLYNVIRLAYIEAGYDVSGPISDNIGDVHVDKLHPFDRDRAEQSDLVFTSYRNLSDVIASLERFNNGEQQSVERINKDVVQLLKWQLYSDHYMRYERMMKDKGEAVRSIIETLGLKVNRESVKKKVEALSEPTDEVQDPNTLMFHNHRTQ